MRHPSLHHPRSNVCCESMQVLVCNPPEPHRARQYCLKGHCVSPLPTAHHPPCTRRPASRYRALPPSPARDQHPILTLCPQPPNNNMPMQRPLLTPDSLRVLQSDRGTESRWPLNFKLCPYHLTRRHNACQNPFKMRVRESAPCNDALAVRPCTLEHTMP